MSDLRLSTRILRTPYGLTPTRLAISGEDRVKEEMSVAHGRDVQANIEDLGSALMGVQTGFEDCGDVSEWWTVLVFDASKKA